MASASYVQTSFLGGEWSPAMQGRMERQDYRSAMNFCFNALPVEEGSWTRRSGTRWLATTRNGDPAVLRSFHFSSAQPYTLEFTSSHLRFFDGLGLVLTAPSCNVASVTNSTPPLATAPGLGISTGDQVQFNRTGGVDPLGVQILLHRQFVVTAVTGDQFTLADPVTGDPIDGSTIDLGAEELVVAKVLDMASPYNLAALPDIRIVQDQTDLLTLHPLVKPWALVASSQPSDTAPAQFTWGEAVFRDGPYLDPYRDGSTVTPTGISGAITLTASIGGGDVEPSFAGWVSSDVGRMIRLFSEPQPWDSGASYAAGDAVKFDGAYWTALSTSVGAQPDLNAAKWTANTSAAVWTWGRISAVNSSTSVDVDLEPAATGEDNVAAGDLIYDGEPISIWRMGLYSPSTGWPTCGTFHEGRIWLAGSIPNRFDGAVSNEGYNFAPTGRDGSVADNSGIAYTFNAALQNAILWMRPDAQGILAGTRDAEWLIRASSLNDPLTPTSIQAKPSTFFGSRNAEPVRSGLSLAFIHKHGKKVLEYVRNPQPGEFSATNLSLTAKHLAEPRVAEVAFQQELAPVIWGRLDDGNFIGCTYKRDDPYGTNPVTFSGWHGHTLGSGRVVESIQVGPSPDGEIDALFMVTNDPDTDVRFVEVIATLYETQSKITDAFYVDCGSPPAAISYDGSTMTFFGFNHLIGETLAVMAGGVDMGDWPVLAGGKIEVTNALDGSLFTLPYLAQLTASGDGFPALGVSFATPDGPAADPDLTEVTRYQDSTMAIQGISSFSINADWSNNRAFFQTFNVDTDLAGIYVINISSGSPIDEISVTDLGFNFSSACPMLYHNGHLYFTGYNIANQTSLRKVNASDYSTVGVFGSDGGGTATDSSHVVYPRQLLGLTFEGVDWIVTGSFASFAREIAIFNMSNMTWTGRKTNTDHGHAIGLTAGRPGKGIGYALAYDNTGTHPTQTLELYVIGVGSQEAITLVGEIAYSDIDPSWSGFDHVAGPMFDATDGHIMFFAEDTGGDVAIVKVHSGTAEVLWKVSINSMPNQDQCLNTSRIAYGKFCYLDGNGGVNSVAFIIDTRDGSFTTATVHGFPSHTSFYDSRTAEIITFANLDTGVPGAPTGATTALNKWFTTNLADLPLGQAYFAPFAIGYTFASRGQILRPIAQSETGAQNGPALGKTRRNHQFAALLLNTQGISFGTVFDNLRPAQFQSEGGIDYTLLQLKSGIHQATIEDDSSYDGMVCWEVTRPYPATVLAIEPFLQTQDR